MTQKPDQAVLAIVVFDIDGVIRDVSGSYRLALADTVEHFTAAAYRPSQIDIDALKAEGLWNNDWEASRELVYRYFESQGRPRSQLSLNYEDLVAFFQRRYRGPDPTHWTGYICQEPLLIQVPYLEALTSMGIVWGFFSGATRGSATYVLEKRLGLESPTLVAMEDAPGKPDPTGLLQTVQLLEERYGLPVGLPVLYAGDTVADLHTVQQAKRVAPERAWLGIGVLPPHAQQSAEYAAAYATRLQQAGAALVLDGVKQLTAPEIKRLVATL